jgi:hypothetical protein
MRRIRSDLATQRNPWLLGRRDCRDGSDDMIFRDFLLGFWYVL